MKKKVVILGAGLAGLSCGYFLKKKGIAARIFEKENHVGGLCVSHKVGDFTFDVSGHLLHFRNDVIKKIVYRLLGGNLIKHKRSAWVYAQNRFIPYPFQANIKYLPKAIFKECYDGLVNVKAGGKKTDSGVNFSDWLYSNFGKGITKYFMAPYNLKFWQTPLTKLSSDWAERFIAVPSMQDIRNVPRIAKNIGYHSYFYYPKNGGIESLVNAFSKKIDNIYLNCQVRQIDIKNKIVEFNKGRAEKFDYLISTIPLPQLSNIIKDLPKDVLAAFRKLRWVSIYNINLGFKGELKPGQHWIYFHQKEFPFFRVGFFNNFSSSIAPINSSSLYIDIAYSKNNPINKNIMAQVIKFLNKVGIVSRTNMLCVSNINNIKYAYPIYDKNYKIAREKILQFLMKHNVISCGRGGSWCYWSMEDVILEAQKQVNSIC